MDAQINIPKAAVDTGRTLLCQMTTRAIGTGKTQNTVGGTDSQRNLDQRTADTVYGQKMTPKYLKKPNNRKDPVTGAEGYCSWSCLFDLSRMWFSCVTALSSAIYSIFCSETLFFDEHEVL
uniref:Uncharacterized protein n=1 Tax=Caenorhabditis tropicalis TaxID=1561998 RepID=A0A1I7UZ30_9PELO